MVQRVAFDNVVMYTIFYIHLLIELVKLQNTLHHRSNTHHVLLGKIKTRKSSCPQERRATVYLVLVAEVTFKVI